MTRRRTGNTAVIRQAFQGLDWETIDMLRRVAVRRAYPPDTALCREGEPADTFYLINTGRMIVTRELKGSDEDFVLGFLGPGQYFGEMAVISDEPRAATVTTLVDTEVLEISKEHFEQVFQSSPSLARSILNTLIRIIRETDARAIEDLEKQIEQLSEAYKALEAAQADRIAGAALEAQLEVAAGAQRSLLPTHLPQVEGYQFAARFEPARHVGGDFYDVRTLDDGRIAAVLADVSDKGPHAALFMAVTRTLFLTEEHHFAEPAAVIRAVHRGLLEATTYEMFVTAVYGVLDPQSGQFRYVRAGHDEPLHVQADGTARFLKGEGRFLGLWSETEPPLDEQEVTLAPGDSLVIYSDGVTDMRDPADESFGREALARLVVTLRRSDAKQIARSIYEAVQEHRGVATAYDDFTLLVIRAE